MEVRTFLLVVIAILGFLSGLLSFIAEGEKLVESNIIRLTSDECVHSRSPALVLGLAAAIALLIGQIISNSLGGCICCELGVDNDSSGKCTPTAVAISFLTLSWITFSISFLLLVAGASINDRRDASDNNLSTGCFVLKSGVFTGAAFASMTTAVLGIAYNLQVFSIRKTMASTVLASNDVGPGSSVVLTNSSNMRQGGTTSESFMATARPVFSYEQKQKIRTVPDHRSAYPRSAVMTNRDIRVMEMASPQSENGRTDDVQALKNMRKALANTETDDLQGSKQMRKTLVWQQQGYSSPDNYPADEEEEQYGSHHARQLASAAYNRNSMDPGGAQFDYEQEGSIPLYIRRGGGSANWEQSYLHQT